MKSPTKLSVVASCARFTRTLVGGAAMLLAALPICAQESRVIEGCGSLENAYGPFDYRTAKAKLHIVESYHFTPQVEALIRGQTGSIGGDLDYTLRAFPNHHRALLALVQAGERARSPQPYGLPRPIECYFERALRFRADDTLTRMIYARFLVTKNRAADARRQLDFAKASAGDNGFSHYNIGLLYFDLQDYSQSRAEAHKAMELGFPKTALRDKLTAIGQWREPSHQPAEAAPSTPAASSASAR